MTQIKVNVESFTQMEVKKYMEVACVTEEKKLKEVSCQHEFSHTDAALQTQVDQADACTEPDKSVSHE